ncbi:hypothetical protein E4191_17875 (plasmid) [Paracoccus liaowanqingii]|uniref:Uncharacterized protein n=1 Tax=Paracoccus liaowanqingii TaxID=2560053 RepID=A0A4Y5SR96_9RHOB|nr:hypothetical protein E4191_17875 [Paracoccus liaowanqingii]
MPVQFILRCRCGHSADLAYDDWEKAKDMMSRAKCSLCGAAGIPALSVVRVKSQGRADTQQQRIERQTGRR